MTVAINFRTSGPWGAGTDVNLRAEDVDRNFYELKRAVEFLEDNPPSPTRIAAFSVNGPAMIITMSDGSTFGPFALPVLTWRWRGDWVPNVPYLALDVFGVTGIGLFLVIRDHTSAVTFDPEETDGDGNPLYRQLFGVFGESTAGVINGLAAGCPADWGLIGGRVSATLDLGAMGAPIISRIDLGKVGK